MNNIFVYANNKALATKLDSSGASSENVLKLARYIKNNNFVTEPNLDIESLAKSILPKFLHVIRGTDAVHYSRRRTDAIPYSRRRTDALPYSRQRTDAIPYSRQRTDAVPYSRQRTNALHYSRKICLR
ncbi:hypothetical protein YYG_01156 [Plasmodium vinckei petteri]|uniref:Fam-a protein n=1 Tax=Plasmodium vinckei petteri TaxID=138298 RepID=W7B5B9_PLAVN|nr:hypothetical protein YYG_01156 [Plasmodium vinckei petteri]